MGFSPGQNPIGGVLIHGIPDTKNRIRKFGSRMVVGIRDEARAAAQETTQALQAAILRSYTRGSTGQTARSVRFESTVDNAGVSVKFYASGRAADFITTLGSGRKQIAGGGQPYNIFPREGNALSFQPKGGGAFTVHQPVDRRRKPTIQFHLGKLTRAYVEHPGFPMGDVILEVGQLEMERYVARMNSVLSRAVAELYSE